MDRLITRGLAYAVLLAAAMTANIEAKSSLQAAAAYDKGLATDMALFSLQAYTGFGLGSAKYKLRKSHTVANDFAFTASGDKTCIISFRGSNDNEDYNGPTGNSDSKVIEFKAKDGKVVAYSHSGFTKAISNFRNNAAFVADVQDCLNQSPQHKLVLTGHSRGASLAALSAIYFAKDASLDRNAAGALSFNFTRLREPRSPYLVVYSYGEPQSLATKEPSASAPLASIREDIVKYRFVNKNDPVPNSGPPTGFRRYRHWGNAFHMTGSRVEPKDEDFPSSAGAGNMMDHFANNYVVRYF